MTVDTKEHRFGMESDLKDWDNTIQGERHQSRFKGLSHLADLARRSYTGAQIWRFSGIGTSTAAQRYHIAKNGSTSSGHHQNIGEKISTGRRRYKFLNMLKNFCRCAAGASNGTTTAVLRYGFER